MNSSKEVCSRKIVGSFKIARYLDLLWVGCNSILSAEITELIKKRWHLL